MPAFDFQQLIQHCDDAIRAGHSHVAAGALRDLNAAKVPDHWRLPLARLCRRTGLWTLGLCLLKTAALGQESKVAATAAESAEYGMLLYRLGATEEAQSILQQVDRLSAPEAGHYLALIHMSKWEFHEACGELQQFLSSRPDPYEALVGRTNLAYAQIEAGQLEIAQQILGENLRECEASGFQRLLCSNLAIRAQLFIAARDMTAARADITAGAAKLEPAATSDQLLFLKWQLILESLESLDPKPLQRLRALALASNSWEYIRLADLYTLRLQFDQSLFLHLIFGTPFPGFRSRICREMGTVPDRDIYYLGPKGSPRFDLLTGEIDGRPADIQGEKPHQLLEVLLRDFYQPMRIAGVFSGLFPGLHFDPKSSAKRTHSTIVRTRQWLRDHRLPVEIREANGFYSLHLTGEFSFRVPLHRHPVETLALQFRQLQRLFQANGTFTAREACQKLQVSRQTLQRIVDWGLENEQLQRLGTGRNTHYQLQNLKSAA